MAKHPIFGLSASTGGPSRCPGFGDWSSLMRSFPTMLAPVGVIGSGPPVGWEFEFPTYTEALIWPVSSLILFVVMMVGGAVPVISTRPWFDFSFNLLWIWAIDARKSTWIKKNLIAYVVNFAYFIYIVARILICAEIFLSFRSLPDSAYEDIDWTGFLPHLN